MSAQQKRNYKSHQHSGSHDDVRAGLLRLTQRQDCVNGNEHRSDQGASDGDEEESEDIRYPAALALLLGLAVNPGGRPCAGMEDLSDLVSDVRPGFHEAFPITGTGVPQPTKKVDPEISCPSTARASVAGEGAQADDRGNLTASGV